MRSTRKQFVKKSVPSKAGFADSTGTGALPTWVESAFAHTILTSLHGVSCSLSVNRTPIEKVESFFYSVRLSMAAKADS